MSPSLTCAALPCVALLVITPLGWSAETPSMDPWRALHDIARGVPDAGDHPGNVFLLGDTVAVRIPPGLSAAVAWAVTDHEARSITGGRLELPSTDSITLGNLGIGWYRVSFHIHTYDWSHGYEQFWEPVREAASGKPLWITESDRGIHFQSGSPYRDLTVTDERKKAQYVTQSYATSLFAGAHRHFHFILGDYRVPWPLPAELPLLQGYDYLGREIEQPDLTAVTSSPMYLVLPAGSCESWPLRLPSASPRRSGSPTPIVLQCLLPSNTSQRIERVPWAWEVEHTVPCDRDTTLPIYVYNFADHAVKGRIAIESFPAGVTLTPDTWQVELPPLDRHLTSVVVRLTREGDTDWIRLRGDFGVDGQAVLALRLRGLPPEVSDP